MCIKVVERYSVCRCIYYSHAADTCPAYGRRGHSIKTQEILVGYNCTRHWVQSVHSVHPVTHSVDDARDLSKRSEGSAADNALNDPKDHLKETNIETAIDSPLRDHLMAKFENVFDTDEHFIPAGDLKQVLTGHTIKAELQRHGLENLYPFVYQRAKKLFAILLVIRKLDGLQNFIKEELGDELLPVVDSALESLTDERLRAAFSGWDLDTRKEFFETQWTVLVPVFFEAEHLKLDDRIASGGFGSVHRVEIHRDHEKFEKFGSPTSQKVGLWTSD